MCKNENPAYERPVIDMAATGRNIEALRRKAGLSVRELQEIFAFSTPQAIYKWQRGEALPTLDNMVILARVLQTSMDEIIAYKEFRRENLDLIGEEEQP